MPLFDVFRRKGTLSGVVAIHNLPDCEKLSVSLTFFRVRGASDAPPYNGVPPASAYTDLISIREPEDAGAKPLTFSVKRPAGYYHLDVGVIAFREISGRMYAHVEHFFPSSAPCEVIGGGERVVELAVQWPSTPTEEMPSYGTVYPSEGKNL